MAAVRARLEPVLRAHGIVAFLCLTFAWSWGAWMLGIQFGLEGSRLIQAIGAWGPLLGAAVVSSAHGVGLRGFLAQVLPAHPLKWRWYGLAILTALAFTQTGVAIGWVMGVPVRTVDVLGVLSTFLFTLFLAGALEEFGWRGFLQARLQHRLSALGTALVVGVIWAIWHAPLVIGGVGAGYEGGEFLGLLIGLPIFSVAMAWLYNSTRGALVVVMLFHATINATPLVEAVEATQLMGIGELFVLLGVPILLVAYYGRATLATREIPPWPPAAAINRRRP